MKLRSTLTTYALLIVASALYVGPFLWLLGTSFKTTHEAVQTPPVLVPWRAHDPADWPKYRLAPDTPPAQQRARIIAENYRKVLHDPAFDMLLYARNTVIIAGLSTLGAVVSSSLVAYSLAKLQWRGREVVMTIVLASMMIPFPVTMVSLYRVFRAFGWIGTNLPLWVPAFCGVPFFIFLLRQFYRTIPNELSDAARIDGCSELGIWWRIILPLSRPALAVTALFAFMGAWNDFLGPLVYLTHQKDFTLSLALQFFQSQSGGTPWELLMAASVLVVSPIILLFFLTQKTFIQGIATTGVKG